LKFWWLFNEQNATRATLSGEGGRDAFVLQVAGSDLVWSARHDLFRGQDSILDEADLDLRVSIHPAHGWRHHLRPGCGGRRRRHCCRGSRHASGETQFLISVIRLGAALAAVPALWIVIQVLPLRPIAHPIWASAAGALGHPLAGSISIDFGASVMALGLYLSTAAIALLSAAVAVDRQRASSILFLVMAATALIALIPGFHDLAGLSFLSGASAASTRAQAIDCAAIGVIVAAAVGIRTLERYEIRPGDSSQASFFWPFAASFTALVICAASLAVNSTAAEMIATAYGLGALIAVAVIRRLGFGPWGIAAIAVPAMGLAVLLIASEPGLRTKGIALAFAVPSPPGSHLSVESFAPAGARFFLSGRRSKLPDHTLNSRICERWNSWDRDRSNCSCGTRPRSGPKQEPNYPVTNAGSFRYRYCEFSSHPCSGAPMC
jgi:hypothetical protein